MILLTTSDYLPLIGGLTTFTVNIENVLKDLNLEYELFHWKNYNDIKNYTQEDLKRFSLIINIHPQFSWISKTNQSNMINFIHGSEILMTSPNIIKKLYKRINRKHYFKRLQASRLNLFISEATLSKANEQGFKTNYARDLIFHNCINLTDAQYVKKEIKNVLSFCCIVRNVPHKNLAGSLKFCELVAEMTGKYIELIVPKNSHLTSNKIKIVELTGISNEERDDAYRNSHYNLLLSLDHSKKGYFEGFGLTVLEAARFGTPSIVMNTGGLSEAVHNGDTGWVIEDVSASSVQKIFNRENESRYKQLTIDCYGHTLISHSLKEYEKLINLLLQEKFQQVGAA